LSMVQMFTHPVVMLELAHHADTFHLASELSSNYVQQASNRTLKNNIYKRMSDTITFPHHLVYTLHLPLSTIPIYSTGQSPPLYVQLPPLLFGNPHFSTLYFSTVFLSLIISSVPAPECPSTCHLTSMPLHAGRVVSLSRKWHAPTKSTRWLQPCAPWRYTAQAGMQQTERPQPLLRPMVLIVSLARVRGWRGVSRRVVWVLGGGKYGEG